MVFILVIDTTAHLSTGDGAQFRDLEWTDGKIFKVKGLRWFALAEHTIPINVDSVLDEFRRVFKVRELRTDSKKPEVKAIKMVREQRKTEIQKL